MWPIDRSCFTLAVVLYGFAAFYTIFLWRQGFRRDNWINYGFLLAGFLVHTTAMLLRGFTLSRCPINNLYEAIMFISWTMVAAYLVAGLWSRMRFLGAFAAPMLFCIGIFALMPGLDAADAKPTLVHTLRSLHAGLILLACGAFGLGAAAGLMYLSQEHDLKFNKARALFALMPPIQRLEMIVTYALIAASCLMTAGLVTGVLYLKQLKNPPSGSDPFMIWSYGVWLFYLGLLVCHGYFAYRGRRFIKAAVGGFLFIMLTFWGFYLLSPVHHP